ncbi:hypothetical protein IEQ34_019607 [Dendrobium chrysotoxum]|uniref:Uncharacterized protein n=1 Tax=Dendrobium chrysotoxum TaxID=161865 RepID=A0AAV7G9G7_DENCH|nr:hypothetical protein IEQ34_019607 [Dendrobium chrysotoxum]
MGVCSSCESTAAISIASEVAPTSTAKLVMDDGRLQEFNRRVKVSEILRQIHASREAGGRSRRAFFVCDSDEMRMEGVLSALEAEAELKAGQLYFLLPLSMLRRRLRPQDMAELAVKASSAFIMSASGYAPLVFPVAGIESSSRPRREVGKKVRSGGRRVKRGASRPYFNLDLSVIPEYLEEEEEDDDDEEEEEEGGLLIV